MSEPSFCPKGRSFSSLKDCVCKQFLLYLWSVSWQQHNWAVIEISRCLLFLPQQTERVSKTQTTPNFLTRFKATFRKDESKASVRGNTLDATMGTDTEHFKASRLYLTKIWNTIPILASRSVPSFGYKLENKIQCHGHPPPEYSQQTEGAPLAIDYYCFSRGC